MNGTNTLARAFHAWILGHGSLPALDLGNRVFSYRELGAAAARVAAEVEARAGSGVVPWLGARGAAAYFSIAGIALAGRPFLCLPPAGPWPQLAARLSVTDPKLLLLDGPSLQRWGARLRAEFPRISLLTVSLPGEGGEIPLSFEGEARVPPSGGSGAAYVCFTSGSTGSPKGVMIPERSLLAYLESSAALGLRPGHRASQFFELTFDLSVHDLFCTWRAGACLVPVPDPHRALPAEFIRDRGITTWFSTPTAILLAARFGGLEPGSLPGLSSSLFCGEPLSLAAAEAWRAAAPESRLWNLYGPTESTICISAFEWERGAAAPRTELGCLPLGRIFPGHSSRVEHGSGELLLAGPQVAEGYSFGDSAGSFFTDERGIRWYRTGDLVREAHGEIFFAGRANEQRKVAGHRVEPSEVEEILRELTGGAAAVLGWPAGPGSASALYAFVETTGGLREEELLRGCREKLPEYMVPVKVFAEALPVGAHGKLDRAALAAKLDGLISSKPPTG